MRRRGGGDLPFSVEKNIFPKMFHSGPAPGGGGITPAKWRGGARPDQGVSGRRERKRESKCDGGASRL